VVVFAGQGDVRRSMALLWRANSPDQPPTGRGGPKPALSVDAIVDAAVAVADAAGMTALSMRAVGGRLGRTAMAIYTHVPSKAELVDLMYDHVHAEIPSRYETAAGWRAATESWAADMWAFYRRHPWVAEVSQARPVLGPYEYTVLDTLIGVLRSTGLPALVLRRVVGALLHLVRGLARTAVESRLAATKTGVPDEAWWLTRAGLLQEVAPDFLDRYRMVAWLETEGASTAVGDAATYLEREAEETLRAGLAVFLDGVEVAMANSRNQV